MKVKERNRLPTEADGLCLPRGDDYLFAPANTRRRASEMFGDENFSRRYFRRANATGIEMAESGAKAIDGLKVWRTRRRFMDSRECQTGCGWFVARGAKDAKRLGSARHGRKPGRVVLRLVWAV